MASANHPKLKRDQAVIDEAQARVQLAWARHLPGITGEFSYQPQTPNYAPTPAFQRVLDRREGEHVTDVVDTQGNTVQVQCVDGPCVTPAPGPVPPPVYKLYNFWRARAGIAWTVYDWGTTSHTRRAARDVVSARRQALMTTQADIRLEVQVAYYDALNAEASVKVAEEELATRKRHLTYAQALAELGRKTGVDVATAEAGVAAAELLMVRAHASESLARASLAVAVGEDSVRDRALVTPSELEKSSEVPPIAPEVVTNRPEVRALVFEASAAKHESSAARGAYLPQIVLEAGPWWAGPALDDLTTNYGAQISLVYPLASGMNPFAVSGQRKQATAQRRALDAQAQVLARELRLELESAHVALTMSIQAVRAAEVLVTAARARRDQAEALYQEGSSTFLELSEAELAFANARLESIRSRYDVGRSRAKLERALGRF